MKDTTLEQELALENQLRKYLDNAEAETEVDTSRFKGDQIALGKLKKDDYKSNETVLEIVQ